MRGLTWDAWVAFASGLFGIPEPCKANRKTLEGLASLFRVGTLVQERMFSSTVNDSEESKPITRRNMVWTLLAVGICNRTLELLYLASSCVQDPGETWRLALRHLAEGKEWVCFRVCVCVTALRVRLQSTPSSAHPVQDFRTCPSDYMFTISFPIPIWGLV